MQISLPRLIPAGFSAEPAGSRPQLSLLTRSSFWFAFTADAPALATSRSEYNSATAAVCADCTSRTQKNDAVFPHAHISIDHLIEAGLHITPANFASTNEIAPAFELNSL